MRNCACHLIAKHYFTRTRAYIYAYAKHDKSTISYPGKKIC